MEFEIKLENLKFYAYHGLFEHEKRDGNEFEVTLSVKFTAIPREHLYPENLQTTISYVSLFKIVKGEMDSPRQLLETVGRNIVERIKREFPFCTSIECKITKTKPPIANFIGSASVICRM